MTKKEKEEEVTGKGIRMRKGGVRTKELAREKIDFGSEGSS